VGLSGANTREVMACILKISSLSHREPHRNIRTALMYLEAFTSHNVPVRRHVLCHLLYLLARGQQTSPCRRQSTFGSCVCPLRSTQTRPCSKGTLLPLPGRHPMKEPQLFKKKQGSFWARAATQAKHDFYGDVKVVEIYIRNTCIPHITPII